MVKNNCNLIFFYDATEHTVAPNNSEWGPASLLDYPMLKLQILEARRIPVSQAGRQKVKLGPVGLAKAEDDDLNECLANNIRAYYYLSLVSICEELIRSFQYYSSFDHPLSAAKLQFSWLNKM